MTVRQLLASLDSREISEWIAYFNLGKAEKEKPPAGSLEQQFKSVLTARRKKK